MASKRTTKCNWAGCIFAIEYLCPDIAKALVLLKAHRMRHEAIQAKFLKGLHDMTMEEGIKLARSNPKSEPPISLIQGDQPFTDALVMLPSNSLTTQPIAIPTQGASDEKTAAVVKDIKEDIAVVTVGNSITPLEEGEAPSTAVEEINIIVEEMAATPAIEESPSTAMPPVVQEEPAVDEDSCRRATTATASLHRPGRPVVRGFT